jgi:Flp pilus assembly protein TadD
MAVFVRLLLLCFLSLGLLAEVGTATPRNAKKPLDPTTLVALVAGHALPENIVTEIGTRGLTFLPTEGFRTQLATAGATSEILKAVAKAPLLPSTDSDALKHDVEGRQHLALAGNLIQNNEYDAAATELDEALLAGSRKAPCGFVMAELLRRREAWTMALHVLEGVLNNDVDFPEAHTKLSFVLLHAGQEKESLLEAQFALQENSSNPEAHKYAGLALESMKKFDAAEQEFREAIRLLPNDENAHFELGVLLHNENNLDGSISEYKKALALNPRDADAHGNLGLAYADKKDYDHAVHELLEAKKLSPKDLEVRRNLEHAVQAQPSR